MLWIILTFPGRLVFLCRGSAYGSTLHCRHCTLGCIAYSRLLYRFSPLRPSFRVPGTQSRRPNSLNGPGPFWHLHLRYCTDKKIYGVWAMVGMHWTVWSGCFMPSCCKYCGLDCSFPVSPIYTLLISLMMSSYSSFYDIVLYVLPSTAVQIRAQYFSQLKTVGRAETLESWPSEKGVTSTWKTKKKHAPGWYGSDCRRGVLRGLPAVFKTLEHDSGDMKALWSQSIFIYIDMYYRTFMVDNARRHDVDCGREGLINYLSFFS